jgi:hypothetical protein
VKVAFVVERTYPFEPYGTTIRKFGHEVVYCLDQQELEDAVRKGNDLYIVEDTLTTKAWNPSLGEYDWKKERGMEAIRWLSENGDVPLERVFLFRILPSNALLKYAEEQGITTIRDVPGETELRKMLEQRFEQLAAAVA